jgi:hypothetical protein
VVGTTGVVGVVIIGPASQAHSSMISASSSATKRNFVFFLGFPPERQIFCGDMIAHFLTFYKLSRKKSPGANAPGLAWFIGAFLYALS